MANTSLRCMNRAVFSSLTKRITSSKTAAALAPSSTLPSSTTSAVSRSSVRRFLTVSRLATGFLLRFLPISSLILDKKKNFFCIGLLQRLSAANAHCGGGSTANFTLEFGIAKLSRSFTGLMSYSVLKRNERTVADLLIIPFHPNGIDGP
ncbi:hypothetical protein HPP92_025161 [Vanilla planifolia]|uniref:Uncharacterized protein n=1 Tax=Vanilla planifolia TaxID=51239 RepID=A0A835PLR2_VANPL|nr:hypothetical protein HPP92_025161 [Vanilla planifolia]